jgi:predicted nucleic acid-binding protein
VKLLPELPSIVVDASALVMALTAPAQAGRRFRHALNDHRIAAPEHLKVEAFHAIRGRVLGGRLEFIHAVEAIDNLAELTVELVPTPLLLGRMWELRNNLSGYDAAYVAAAERLQVPLLTHDKRLAAAPDLRCELRSP